MIADDFDNLITKTSEKITDRKKKENGKSFFALPNDLEKETKNMLKGNLKGFLVET